MEEMTDATRARMLIELRERETVLLQQKTSTAIELARAEGALDEVQLQIAMLTPRRPGRPRTVQAAPVPRPVTVPLDARVGSDTPPEAA